MRKLILIGILMGLAGIAWISYLRYDINRFRKDLGTSPILEQKIRSATTNAVETPATDGHENERSGQENTQVFSQEERDEGTTQTIKTSADTEGKVDDLGPDQISNYTELSPELEKVFIAYNDLYEESIVVGRELSPMLNKTVQASSRMSEIDRELSTTTDPAKLQSLYNERDKIDAWVKEIKPTVVQLQNELRRIREDGETLFREYGFSTGEDFWKSHSEVYKAWRAKL